ncbi:hypothetical protein A0H81_12648 [Grifola frondosa]|uniref:Uncharacterized protein n=1 Tax=Grifola frondosa TaxID=5627 RepID=A0A1C7LRM8_GRIFR|nr:hypothetical protein A0H81_12648 [Grifola frondosa]
MQEKDNGQLGYIFSDELSTESEAASAGSILPEIMFLRVLGSFFVAVLLWRLVKRLTKPKSPLADVAGPAKDHWLKGNYHRLFQDGLEYNLRLVAKYGGVIRVHALLG